MKTTKGVVKEQGVFLLTVALMVVLGTTVKASAQTLQGERFFSLVNTVEGQCAEDPSQPSSLSFYTTGGATGPYPGTFVEKGTFTIQGGVVTEFQSTFTIYSTTIIQGQKSLLSTNAFGLCTNNFGGSGSRFVQVYYPLVNYQTNGGVRDGGIADTYVQNAIFGGGGSFVENFLLSTGEPRPTPVAVVLSPLAATNEVGTSHMVTATVLDAGGQPVQQVSVLFTVEGSVSTTGSCTTDNNGQCSFTYQGPEFPGADLITGCADSNDSSTADADEPCGTATKSWILPPSTPGQVTGGGQILHNLSFEGVAFGFNAQNTDKGFKGQGVVVDHTTQPNTVIKLQDVTSLVVIGTHATFFGNATVNGVATTYRVDVDDLGEPGLVRDIFKIQTDSGYTAGGPLTGGNIQIHKQPKPAP